jgi:photosystem II stability/assembly factor-like uncharacterized protein
MKKQLFTLALSAVGLSAFSQASTVWQPYNSNLDTSTYVRFISAVDTNTVWGLSGSTLTLDKFTRTIDGANFHSGNFLPDTTTYAASGISAVSASTAYITTYVKAASGAQGQVLKTTDGGVTWTNVVSTATASPMFAGANNFPDWVHFYDANNGIVLGDPNGASVSTNTVSMFEIWRTHDGGTNWARVADANVPVPAAGEYGLTSSYTTYKHFIWSGTTAGRVYASADSGKTWTVGTGTTGLAGGVSGLAFRDSIHGMIWGGTSTTATVTTILSTADGGNTWIPVVGTASVGVNDICRIPKTKGYMSVGVNATNAAFVTSTTYDDGATWTVLETGPLTNNNIRMLSLQMLDSLNGWAGSFSSSALPHGLGGMNRFKLGHKLGCPIGITTASSSTPFNVCLGSAITLTASGLNTYTWSTTANTASVSVTPTVSTSYSVAGTTTAGCANYDMFNVTVISGTVTTTAASHTVCPNTPTTLHVAGATTYSWMPASGLSSTTTSAPVSSPSASVTYTITGVKNLCNLTPATIAMITKPAPNLTVTATSPTVCIGGSDSLKASGAATYTWSGGATATTANIAVTPTATTVYSVTATGTVNTCTSKTSITVTTGTVGCVGIENYNNATHVALYPNPSTGMVTITLSNVDAGTVMYVTNMIGQQVAKTALKDLNTNFDFSTLEKGVYFVTVTSGNNKHVEKLIIQ